MEDVPDPELCPCRLARGSELPFTPSPSPRRPSWEWLGAAQGNSPRGPPQNLTTLAPSDRCDMARSPGGLVLLQLGLAYDPEFRASAPSDVGTGPGS